MRVKHSGFSLRRDIVVGCDCAIGDQEIVAAAVLVRADGGHWRPERGVAVRALLDFPYIPGLLSFREVPALRLALDKLGVTPHVLLVVDGHGRIHPSRFGLAVHLGFVLDRASLGIAKRTFVGQLQGKLATQAGATARMEVDGEPCGWALRSRDDTRPVYVSPGHGLSLPAARGWGVSLLDGYRLPGPVRCADRWSRAVRRGDAVPDWLRVETAEIDWRDGFGGAFAPPPPLGLG